MDRDAAIIFGVAIVVGALFGAIYVVGLQQSSPELPGTVNEPPPTDVPPSIIESIRDDPPSPRFSEEALAPDRPDVPENEVLQPPEPGADDILEPPVVDPESCIGMEFVSPPSNVTAGEAFTLVFHEWASTPDYQGDVLNFIFISPADSEDVIVRVPLQYGQPPFRNIDVEMTDGDGYVFGPILDLSRDGESLLGYTWTPRQSEEWWLPIDMSILEPGEYVISMAAYDVRTCVKVAEDISIDLEVADGISAGNERYFTNVSTNGLDMGMVTNTTYRFDITADATPRYLQLLKDSLRKEPGGTSCHIDESDAAFSWRLDLFDTDASDLRYSHYLRGYFVGDPANEGFPGTRTPEPIDGGVRLALGSAPMAHAYSAYGMGQQYWDCNTTFSDAAMWNATMECAIFFTVAGTYEGELYLVGPERKDASERLPVRITVTGGESREDGPPDRYEVPDGAPNETPSGPTAPMAPNDTSAPPEEPEPERPQETPPAPSPPPVMPEDDGSDGSEETLPDEHDEEETLPPPSDNVTG
ncbi:MAG TPA: hypothetical protein PLD09_04765 [Methanomassiliicoccaceae archaeon]|nr:hypothetical protein [Methanomassiliicoccaceae archaeon]